MTLRIILLPNSSMNHICLSHFALFEFDLFFLPLPQQKLLVLYGKGLHNTDLTLRLYLKIQIPLYGAG